MKVLDYSAFRQESRWTDHHMEWQGGSDRGRVRDPTDVKFFEARASTCPFCRHKVAEVHRDIRDAPERRRFWPLADYADSMYAFACPCGWWSTYYFESDDFDGITASTLTSGILRRFDLDSVDVPINSLRTYLDANPQRIDRLHPRKMEELVCSLFGDFYPGCTVEHCGRTGDGGFDLFVVLSDIKIAVQVKHRDHVRKGEGVAPIRELLGAMQVSNLSAGAFVTTANHFTSAAIAARDSVLRRGAVKYFELIDRHRLFDMFALYPTEAREHWRDHIGDGPDPSFP